jgi:hypothetical protein
MNNLDKIILAIGVVAGFVIAVACYQTGYQRGQAAERTRITEKLNELDSLARVYEDDINAVHEYARQFDNTQTDTAVVADTCED